jgi:ribosome maturation factor RimP
LATTGWRAAVERTVTGSGYELVDVERSAGGLLRVYIDRLPGRAYPSGDSESVTVDDCERVTRQLQYALQVDDVDYARLEVSSPGLDRPLRRQADYERFAGATVDLSLKQPLGGRKNFRGRLVAGPQGWRLELQGVDGASPAQALDFALDEVREARLVPVLDFKGRKRRAGSPGAAPAPAGGDDGGLTR